VLVTELIRTWAHLPFTLQLLKFCRTFRDRIILTYSRSVKVLQTKLPMFPYRLHGEHRLLFGRCVRADVPADVIQL